MEWYCAVFNSDNVSSAAGAQILYEKLCEGDDSLVGDIDLIENFYEDLIKQSKIVKCNKCGGYVIISTDFENAEFVNDVVKTLAKKHGLSFYEPQNMVYQY